MMTEIEISLTLGLASEPECNRVHIDPLLETQILYLKHVFAINRLQVAMHGRANSLFWADLLPCHSLN